MINPKELFLNHNKGGNHYILSSKTKKTGWFGVYNNVIQKLQDRFGDEFYLLIYDDYGYFVIPWTSIKHMFLEENKTREKKRTNDRWTLTRYKHGGEVDRHELRMKGRADCFVDITMYWENNADSISGPPHRANASIEAHSVEASLQEAYSLIKQRKGQSVFRDKTIHNFHGKCCITGIDTVALLEASHIVPWSKEFEGKKTHQLDVSNGICLYVEFHALFDNGYITFDDKMRVIVSSSIEDQALKAKLAPLHNFQATIPVQRLNTKYLDWHRVNIFQ